MPLVSWISICLPWSEGGFDKRELLSWNKALISKSLWQVTQGTNRLWMKWINAYHLGTMSIWKVQQRVSHSQSFRDLLKVRDEWVDNVGYVASAIQSLELCSVRGKLVLSAAFDAIRKKGDCGYQDLIEIHSTSRTISDSLLC
ncbi:hypothetical protein RND81_08G154600 [Saponaria officinalis]|uniref:Uncharacterized protein n=1 Tax=Saponaria officinalis TaxID=3572 RepID=A0AAW1J9B0_SAPOF